MNKLKILTVVSAATMLSSCDLSQIPGVSGKLSIEDSKAVGAACRHSGRALEDCFTLNPNTSQSGVFEGWREMNDYMLANEIEVVKPEIRTSAFPAEKPVDEHGGDEPHKAPAEKEKQSAEKPEAAPPPVSGRERWTPRSATPADPARRAEGGTPPAEAAQEEPVPEPPPRPWERKKDPKKHT